MGLFDFFRRKTRSEPVVTGSQINYSEYFTNWLTDCEAPRGYRTLAEVPEIKSAVEKIAEVVSTMTIHLMVNGENGDTRIVNELSKKIDIRPNNYMSRQLFISWVVQEMLLKGNALVRPRTHKGLLMELKPVPNHKYEFIGDEFDYYIQMFKNKRVSPDSYLHFRFNPDLEKPWLGRSQEVILRDLKDDLYQANKTVKDFMSNKLFPNVIIKVDALTEELATESGRDKIEEKYLKRAKTGQPWIVPSELFEIEQIKPLTLKDIAIHDSIKINKQTVAGILGVPAFLLGVGEFNRDEYNHFIKNKVAVICKAIETELTEKLLVSPNMYFKFNMKSMLNYDVQELGDLYLNLYTKGVVTGNEVRDALGMSPLDGLDNLIILENYIPVDKIGDQNKLGGGESEKDV